MASCNGHTSVTFENRQVALRTFKTHHTMYERYHKKFQPFKNQQLKHTRGITEFVKFINTVPYSGSNKKLSNHAATLRPFTLSLSFYA